MKSPRGLAGAVVFLLAVPVAALYQAVFTDGVEAVIHVALAAGAALVASAAGDFKTARWIRWTGWVSAGAMAVIFLLQAVAELVRNDALTRLAYQVLGQRLEGWLVYLFLLWCLAVLVVDSSGRTRLLGLVAVALAASAGALDQKLLGLLPFVWLLFESARRS
jgi:hypothetical protein